MASFDDALNGAFSILEYAPYVANASRSDGSAFDALMQKGIV
ncbi:hypothetical protein [Photobacterium sanguinicancri]|nr:hypothetical protein [Photobacterium sanguinicancri]